ncbi:DUF1127 domain-containing protein [Oleomonas cavernae]|uniref:DUF1127 domain-containing protein n=1 Tax=Oleomonas cavernae TaxID=2320859 RepID=A0A418WUP3_9PROT|nr:DUF1127 domain-containing protein [Oleomonas cavernae]RJF94849.1 DUF1127 domain-containing protein [Oleomonas cavernae]
MRSPSSTVSSPSLPRAGVLQHLWPALAAFLERRRARRALQNMDAHLLRDIGLHRSQIEAAVRGDQPY